jgi:hypothetical protein
MNKIIAAAAISEAPQEGEGGSGGDKAAGSVSARDHHLLICRYCNCNRSERRCATVAVLVRAGGGHSGVSAAAAAWPSERRLWWPWREPQLGMQTKNDDLLPSRRAWPMNRHYSKDICIRGTLNSSSKKTIKILSSILNSLASIHPSSISSSIHCEAHLSLYLNISM